MKRNSISSLKRKNKRGWESNMEEKVGYYQSPWILEINECVEGYN